MADLGPEGLRKKKEMEKQLRQVAEGMADKMIAKQDSVSFLRFFGATVNNILVRCGRRRLE